MTDASPRPPSWRDWTPVFATLITVVAAIMVFGGILNEVKTNTANIAEMKAQQRSDREKFTQDLSAIRVTTERTDATLQALRGQPEGIRQ